MISNKKIIVVIPCYKVSEQITEVLTTIPSFVDTIIVVDDACPENSGAIAKTTHLEHLLVISHNKNKGVGGAMVTGFKKALELDCDIVVKIDGDGQMNPNHIAQLIQLIIEGKADYTKGNRFNDFKALRRMPKTRLFGNSVLSFMIKATSGYWNIMDPTNGFNAITTETIKSLRLDKISKGFFYETDMLVNLNLLDKVVKDIPIPAVYGHENSNLSIGKVLLTFPFKMIRRFMKRIFYKYYIYNFNMASIYILISIPLLIFGFSIGFYKWHMGIVAQTPNNAGTIMLAALPIILGVQFLLQAISIDINSVPKKD
ncbi:glycosyltransferase family 2 protein [Winogradskyella sp.]|uniref:glycosyltransferase family 2 protein n=1 Tax=Winogradskyella sp. TaxID=1883156 RepID=UPI003BA9B515